MPTPNIKATYFWHNEPSNGHICEACQLPIVGDVYYPMIQYGEATELQFRDGEPKICHACYLELPKEKR